MSQIQIQYATLGAPTNTTTTKLKDAGNAYGIKNAATGAVVVGPTGVIAPTALGTYIYDTSALPAASYLATWEVITPNGTTYVNEPFTIDAASVAPAGVSLQQIERELAMRVGTFRRESASTPSSQALVYVPAMKSRLSLGGIEDLYLLRRGRNVDGSVVVGFVADDRVRIVSNYDPATGTLQPDRDWSVAPSVNEWIELHHLHPALELRVAVLAGLRRTFFMDQAAVTFTSAAAERNLTTLLPWLSNHAQVVGAEWSMLGQPLIRPRSLGWFRAVSKADGVYLRAARDPYPQTLQLTAIRPAWSYVNGTTSINGPDDDDDIVATDLDYAVAAAHVEAWRRFPSRMQAAAEAGMQLSRADAAAELSKQSRAKCPVPAEVLQLSDPIGFAFNPVQG